MKLRVATYNIHKGVTGIRGRPRIADVRQALDAIDADVVFLQEVQGLHSGRARRVVGWPEAPHYEYLADRIWPQFAYGRNAVHPLGHHGNAVLSKYPIVRFENHDVSLGGQEARGLLHCELVLPGSGRAVHAVCVHLSLREGDRRRQLDLLCDLVAARVPAQAPLVVAGDFNDWRRRAHAVLQRRAGLHEVHVAARGRAATTFPALLPLLQLDRIYVRNARRHRPLDLPRHPWAHLSDHAPLAAEVHL